MMDQTILFKKTRSTWPYFLILTCTPSWIWLILTSSTVGYALDRIAKLTQTKTDISLRVSDWRMWQFCRISCVSNSSAANCKSTYVMVAKLDFVSRQSLVFWPTGIWNNYKAYQTIAFQFLYHIPNLCKIGNAIQRKLVGYM